jgi:hypothetical protein
MKIKNNKKDIKKKSNRSNAGRKQFDGKSEKDVLSKLEYVWSVGGTDEEACVYADITVAGLQRYQDKHPEISIRKKLLKEKPVLLAREAVIQALKEKNPDIAIKYLERKKKDEFSLKTETAHSGSLSEVPQARINIINTKTEENK